MLSVNLYQIIIVAKNVINVVDTVSFAFKKRKEKNLELWSSGKVKRIREVVEPDVFYRIVTHISKIVNGARNHYNSFDDLLIMRLSELKSGERGTIISFQSPDLELKLMEMGCLPGEEVVVEQIAPLGDPISIRIAGYSLSLRKNEANQVIIER